MGLLFPFTTLIISFPVVCGYFYILCLLYFLLAPKVYTSILKIKTGSGQFLNYKIYFFFRTESLLNLFLKRDKNGKQSTWMKFYKSLNVVTMSPKHSPWWRNLQGTATPRKWHLNTGPKGLCNLSQFSQEEDSLWFEWIKCCWPSRPLVLP